MSSAVITIERVIPVLRMFDVAKAREFYVDWLGFNVDWEHRFEENAPLYMQLSPGEMIVHLSEHYGDGCPGAVVYVSVRGIDEWHRQLSAKRYKYLRPGIQTEPWNARCMNVIDPFGNRIRFCEDMRG